MKFNSYKKVMDDYKEASKGIKTAAKEILEICIEDRKQQGKSLSNAKIRQLRLRIESALRFGEGFDEEYWERYQIYLDYRAKFKRLYDSKKWKKFRERWLPIHPKCEECGTRENLVIHHVHPREVYFLNIEKKTPEEILNIIDFKTLCRKCHCAKWWS